MSRAFVANHFYLPCLGPHPITRFLRWKPVDGNLVGNLGGNLVTGKPGDGNLVTDGTYPGYFLPMREPQVKN